MFLAAALFFTLVPVADAVQISGRLDCIGTPHYAYGAVSAFELSDFSPLDTVFVDNSDQYSLTVPDHTDVVLIAISGSGRNLEGYSLSQYEPAMLTIRVETDDLTQNLEITLVQEDYEVPDEENDDGEDDEDDDSGSCCG